MLTLIAQIILVLSLGGVAFLVAHKIPVLSTLPEIIEQKRRGRLAVAFLRGRISAAKEGLAKRAKASQLEALQKERYFKQDWTEKKKDFSDDYWSKMRDE